MISTVTPGRPSHPRELFRVLGQRFLWSQSPFAREIIRSPGSWRCLDHIYRNTPGSWLDRGLLALPACRGTRERLQAYRQLLGDAVATIAEEPVRLLDLGSGPGWAPLDLVASSPRKIAVTCVDRAADALEAGREFASRRGLRDHLSFHRSSIRQFIDGAADGSFHIVGTHGVLDYLAFDEGTALFERIRRVLTLDGVLVTSNMRRHPDWVARFLMEFFGGWRLHYRDEKSLATMLEATGYVDIATRLVPGGFHVLATARQSSTRPDSQEGSKQ